mmetsp:Transcript_130273/g.278398  ORF Transcript_130273/g.278398 Transcript_130273/m.278398 type:complete len:156 (+) Transcript_130273:325-792(+)
MVERRCAMAKEVRPALAASSAAPTTCSLCVSNALVASSNRRIGGFRTKARQMATRCFCPPERRFPRGPTCVSQPCAVPTPLSMKLRFAMRLHSANLSSVIVSLSSRPYFTLLSTVPSKRIGSCPTKPTCFLHHRMLILLRSVLEEPIKMDPDWGS